MKPPRGSECDTSSRMTTPVISDWGGAWVSVSVACVMMSLLLASLLLQLDAQRARDHHLLDLVRTLADLEDLCVTVEARDRELVHEAVAAVDLQREVRHLAREDAGLELGHGGNRGERLALVLQPRRLVGH